MTVTTMIRRTLLACGLLQAGVAAAEGALDTHWGVASTGKSPIAFDFGGNMGDFASGSVIGPDGSMYISGTVLDAGGVSRMGVTRLLPNGLIDTNFGTDGRVLTQSSQGELFNTAGIVMKGNSLLVGGYKKKTADNWDFVLCALSTSGVPLLFNSTLAPCVSASFDPGPSLSRDIPRAMAVQADGKVVMAGNTAVATVTDTYAAFARFNTDGALDHTFGLSNSGIQLTRSSNFLRHQINAIAIASNGKIVGVGKTDVVGGSDSSALIVRLDTDGTVEQLSQSNECSFEVDGSNSRDTELLGLTMVPNGGGLEDDFVAVGYAQMSGTVHSGLIAKRRGATCAYDANFSGGDGSSGYTVVTAGDSMTFESVATQPNVGYVIAATYTSTGGDADWLIGRYRPGVCNLNCVTAP